MRHLCGFIAHIKADVKEPLKTYGKAIKNIFSDHIFNMLVDNLEVVAHRIKEPGPKTILECIQIAVDKLGKEIEHPQCIWNASTREELKAAFKEQLEVYHKNPAAVTEENCLSILKELKYTAHKDEVIIRRVFIRILNKDPYMSITNPSELIISLIKEMAKITLQDIEADTQLCTRAVSLFESLSNILFYQKGIDLKLFTQNRIQVLCNFIIQDTEKIAKYLEKINHNVWSVLIEISKESRQAIALILTIKFQKIALYILTKLTNETLIKNILCCFDNIINQKESDEILLNFGFLIIFLNYAFDKSCEKKYRHSFIKYSQILLIRAKLEGNIGILYNIIPQSLLEHITDEPVTKSEELLEFLDTEHTDLYLIWNKEINAKVIEALLAEKRKIEDALSNNKELIVEMWKPPSISYISDIVNRGEIVISGIIISEYIKSPNIRFKVLERIN